MNLNISNRDTRNCRLLCSCARLTNVIEPFRLAEECIVYFVDVHCALPSHSLPCIRTKLTNNSKHRIWLKMLCRDGQISLISFLSSIATSMSTSILLLYYFSLDLNSLRNFVIVFAAAIIFYIIHCVVALIFLAKTEFEVNTEVASITITLH